LIRYYVIFSRWRIGLKRIGPASLGLRRRTSGSCRRCQRNSAQPLRCISGRLGTGKGTKDQLIFFLCFSQLALIVVTRGQVVMRVGTPGINREMLEQELLRLIVFLIAIKHYSLRN